MVVTPLLTSLPWFVLALLLSGCVGAPVPWFVLVVLAPGVVLLCSLLCAIVILASVLFWIYALDLVRQGLRGFR